MNKKENRKKKGFLKRSHTLVPEYSQKRRNQKELEENQIWSLLLKELEQRHSRRKEEAASSLSFHHKSQYKSCFRKLYYFICHYVPP